MSGFWDAGDHDGPALPPGRRMVLCVSCRSCDSLDVVRERSVRDIAYWACETCGHRWRESGDVGRNSAKIAD